MAVVAYTERRDDIDYDAKLCAWTPLTTANTTGQPFYFTGSGDRTVQVFGTFGAAGSVAIEGSLDGKTFASMKDPTSTTIGITAAGLAVLLENVVCVRPKLNGGDGTSAVTVLLGVRKK